VAIAGPVYAEFLERRLPDENASAIAPSVTNGWQVSVPGLTLYRPHYFGARATLDATYEKNGRQVGVFVGYYARQQEGVEMISTMHSVAPDRSRFWIKTGEQRITDRSLGLDLVQTRLRSSTAELTVWHWYWAGGRWVLQPERIKLIQAFEKLIGRDAAAAIIVLFVQSDRSGRASDSVLREFSRDMAPSLDAALREIRARSAERNASALLSGH
jgi:EpsI family protein